MPLGMGIGMLIPLSPLMPDIPDMFIGAAAVAGFPAGFAPGLPDVGFFLPVSAFMPVIPGIPAIGSGFFAGGFV
jgi:hypothetical protein